MFNDTLAASAPTSKMDARIPRMDPEEAEQIRNTPPVYMFNLSPREFESRQGQLGRFVIPAREPGQEVSKPLCIAGWLPETGVDAVDGRTVTFKWLKTSGRKVAQDILGSGKTKYQSLEQYGVFISNDATPSHVDISRAKVKLHAHYQELVQEANEKYKVNGGMEMGDDGKFHPAITKDHIEAAQGLGIQPPWLGVSDSPVQMVETIRCPECGTENRPNAIRCKDSECRLVFDEERARERFPEMFANEKRGPGRPRSVDA